MPEFVTAGYGGQAGYEPIPLDVRGAAHAHDTKLEERGALIAVAGVSVQVRNPNATGAQTENAALMSSPPLIAGFAVIEAADMAEAVTLVSRSPCAFAHGVVEAWPLQGT